MKCPKCHAKMIHLNYGGGKFAWFCLSCGTEVPINTQYRILTYTKGGLK